MQITSDNLVARRELVVSVSTQGPSDFLPTCQTEVVEHLSDDASHSDSVHLQRHEHNVIQWLIATLWFRKLLTIELAYLVVPVAPDVSSNSPPLTTNDISHNLITDTAAPF